MILVTGGAGYIGSHTTLALLQAGCKVVVLDNLCNSSKDVLKRIAQISSVMPEFVLGDCRDRQLLDQLFARYPVTAVLHFAGFKSVSESIREPLKYYDNNVTATTSLCQAMTTAGVFTLVFSSSATVYGDPTVLPISENQILGRPTHPYGRSKIIAERILTDLAASDARWRIALLRYFNPIGAHESGLIGDCPQGALNNLLSYIGQVAIGKLPELTIFGNDYPTPDGTGVRDYIHVEDVASGHLDALQALESRSGAHIWNLGSGLGYSVLEIVRAFEATSGRKIPYHIGPRRVGDMATVYADPSKAERELGWRAQRDLAEMMRDAWRWQLSNA